MPCSRAGAGRPSCRSSRSSASRRPSGSATGAGPTRKRSRWSPPWTNLRDLLRQSALATSVVAAGWLALGLPVAAPFDLAPALAWLALVWLALAWRYASPGLFAAFQMALTGSLVFTVATLLGR